MSRSDDAPPSADLARWSDDARARFARRAAEERDAGRLWDLVLAHLGASGRVPSGHTRRAYRRGVAELVALFPGDLLAPAADAGGRYEERLRQGDRPLPDPSAPRRRGRPPKRGPLAPATVEARLAAARALYAALRWTDVTDADPFGGRAADADGEAAGAPHYTEHELRELLGRARDHDDRLLLLLGAHAGLRVSEMLALAWGDVDLDAGTLVLRGGERDEAASIELTRPLIGALRDAATRTKPPAPVAPVLRLRSQYGLYRRLQRLCLRAEVPFRGVHALRHAAGMRLLRAGGDARSVRDALRHASGEMARRYGTELARRRAAGGHEPDGHDP